VSKKKDRLPGAKEDSEILPVPEPPPLRTGSSGLPPAPPGPRATRFGSGPEGEGGRRERGGGTRPPGFFGRAAQFIRDTRSEMKRVTWPSGNEVYKTTIITIIAVIFFAVYLFAIDRVWAFLIEQLDNLLMWLTGAA
jgi:preprotein translocase SecE subunit